MILELASQMLKELVQPNKLLLIVCNSRFFEEQKNKIFFSQGRYFF